MGIAKVSTAKAKRLVGSGVSFCVHTVMDQRQKISEVFRVKNVVDHALIFKKARYFRNNIELCPASSMGVRIHYFSKKPIRFGEKPFTIDI